MYLSAPLERFSFNNFVVRLAATVKQFKKVYFHNI